MGKGLLFFCCSCCVLVLTIINLSIGPIISRRAGIGGTENCAKLSDDYDKAKEANPNMRDEEKKYGHKWYINRCKNEKGMHDMEYTSFIFDIVIGFVCGLIGLLHLFDLKKDFVSNTGLIGLGCGVVGFVLTFVYVILNGIVYTSYYHDNNALIKTDGEGAWAERVSAGKYECMYYDTKGNYHAYYAKFSDLIKKQYNYNKDLAKEYQEDYEKKGCQITFTSTLAPEDLCDENGVWETTRTYTDANGNSQDCKYLYSGYQTNDITNKDVSDRFLTTLILSLFVCLANIGLALFGFLLFRNPSDF